MRTILLLAISIATTTTMGTSGAAIPDDPASGVAAIEVPDEDVPYGIAASWLLGHQMLEEGRAAEALPYLHQAYRAQPEATSIALDFQAALAAEGYFRDAILVLDKMVMEHPDSTSFRLRRSALLARSGDEAKALAELKQMRVEGDDSLEILHAEAALLDRSGKSGRALEVLRGGLTRFPEAQGDLYLVMAGILQREDKIEDLALLMEEAIAVEPGRAALWLVRIRSFAALGLDDEAAATAAAADLNFSMTSQDGSESERPGGTTGTDEDEYGSGGRADNLPADSFIVELADYYAQQKRIDKAISLLQPLARRGELRLNPSLWLGRMLLGTGRQAEGAALVEDAVKRWPHSGRAWFLKGKVVEAEGAWSRALEHYTRATQLAPGDGEVRLACVRAMLVAWERDLAAGSPTLEQLGRRAQLSEQCFAASALVPEQDSGGRMVLGYAFRAVKDLGRAAENFGMAALDGDLKLVALIQKSLCHDELGENERAREDLETLHRDFPENAEVANSLGYFLAEKNTDLTRAEKLVRSALSVEPGNGAYLDSLGWVLYRQGRLEGALDFLIQAVNVLPEDAVVLEHLGMALKAGGKPTEAIDALRRALLLGAPANRVKPVIDELESRTPVRR